jgi:predicted transcriptional regulator
MESGTVSAVLDGNVLGTLKQIAAEEDRSISWVVGAAVKQYIAQRGTKGQVFREGAARLRQVDLVTAIADQVKRGPVKSPARHK